MDLQRTRQAARLLTLVLQLRDLYRHHIATEDNEVFPAAAAALSASDRQAIGGEMASRRSIAGSDGVHPFHQDQVDGRGCR